MAKVTQEEAIAEMHDLIGEGTSGYSTAYNSAVRECIRIAERIQSEGIAPPDGAPLFDAIIAAFRRGFAEASSNYQGFLDSSPPSVGALIAEIDARPRYCGQSDAAIDAILEKYRSKP